MMLNTFQSKVACNYLKILILPDQLLPGKDLIGLDALKAVLSLFILKKKKKETLNNFKTPRHPYLVFLPCFNSVITMGV